MLLFPWLLQRFGGRTGSEGRESEPPDPKMESRKPKVKNPKSSILKPSQDPKTFQGLPLHAIHGPCHVRKRMQPAIWSFGSLGSSGNRLYRSLGFGCFCWHLACEGQGPGAFVACIVDVCQRRRRLWIGDFRGCCQSTRRSRFGVVSE